jgi:prolyl-tRNA synthetase
MKIRAPVWRARAQRPACRSTFRSTHSDSRQRLSNFWIPTVNIANAPASKDVTQLLESAGYLRNPYSGIFHMLPLGLRVQEKLERLIDKHMRTVGASKASLSSLSPTELWRTSGRLEKSDEMFTLTDRKHREWLLAPTHEEEITTLLCNFIQRSSQLPVRLYQIGRKYRDEFRPRGGLLRGREFLMKDLYTFDVDIEAAHRTYDDIRVAYRSFLDELKIPYIEARASSGDMGGNLSHEYHFPNPVGEDIVITCSECDYCQNEEVPSEDFMLEPLGLHNLEQLGQQPGTEDYVYEDFVTRDPQKPGLVRVFTASESRFSDKSTIGVINTKTLKAVLHEYDIDIDTSIEDPLAFFEGARADSSNDVGDLNDEFVESGQSVYFVMDSNLPTGTRPQTLANFHGASHKLHLIRPSESGLETPSSFAKHQHGDACPRCKTGTLAVDRAIEVAHTFYLGTRYSSKLQLTYTGASGQGEVPVEMGCHGIGVSRLIAATATCLSDEVGLNWPRAIAPFETLIAVQPTEADDRLQVAEKLYDQLSAPSSEGSVDVILDDRAERGIPYKLKDADLIGYPVIVVLGKTFKSGKVEVQCRRLKVKEQVEINAVADFVRSLLEKL